MKRFFKCATVTLGVQAILILLLGLLGNLISPAIDSLFEVFLRIYEPFIVLVARVGRFKGESAMIEPVWMGIVLGVLSYSVAFGLPMMLLKKGR
jgi:hypothetical protein